jgi:diguanylate cyclase (GGDEF)-like protein
MRREASQQTGGDRARRPAGLGITARLLILGLVPLIGLVLVASSTTVMRLHTADRAGAIEQDVNRLGRLVEARSAVRSERVSMEALLQARALGVSTTLASQLLGGDITTRLKAASGATDRALEKLGPDRSLGDPTELAKLRAGLRHHSIGVNTLIDHMQAIDDRFTTAIDHTLSGLDVRTDQISGGGPIIAGLDALRATTFSVDAVTEELNGLERLTFGTPSQRQTALLGLAAARDRYVVAAHELNGVGVPAVAATWKGISRSADSRALHAAVDRQLNRTHIAAAPTSAVQDKAAVDALLAGLHTEDRHYALVRAATAATRARAVALRGSTMHDLRLWMLLAGLLVLATLAVSIWAGRSISRPLKLLAEHAEAVREGDLDVAPLPRRGPRDIVVTCEAFDDLVANLRLLEAKSQALATLELDSPVLGEPLPGRLGASLQESVQVLSGSILERNVLQEHLVHQATHDALTGLHNRVAAADALESALTRARVSGVGLALLFVDLDDFKRANDTHGHAVGDQVLRVVAERMQEAARPGDFVARLGGDEFMILAERVTDPTEAVELGRQLVEVISTPVQLGSLRVGVGASVGIALAANGDEEPTQLLAWADLAVYRAKQHSGGGVELYDKRLQQHLLEQAEVEEALSQAIAGDELFLLYQPILDAATGRIVELEALVRWDRPGVGVQEPATFIPVAEASNLVVDVDCWTLSRAARQLSTWDADPDLAGIRLSVNVSGRHLLSHSLPANVAAVLEATGIEPSRLTLEITETVLVSDLPHAASQLHALRELGVQIAIDDFGTGYTSITQLQQLPVDVIKIDRSFVVRATRSRDRTLLAMIADLGHHLGLAITAEGVETSEQLDVVRELGCDRVQGFLLSRPVSTGAVTSLALGQEHLSHLR